MNLSLRLSEHFTLGEAVASMDADRHGIDNSPPPEMIPKLAYVAATILEPVRAKFGPFSPSSWFRSVALNEVIGGAGSVIARKKNPTSQPSQHMKGEAVDIKIPGVTTQAVAAFVFATLPFDQLILEFWHGDVPSSGWTHVSAISAGKARHMAGTYFGGRYNWNGIPK